LKALSFPAWAILLDVRAALITRINLFLIQEPFTVLVKPERRQLQAVGPDTCLSGLGS